MATAPRDLVIARFIAAAEQEADDAAATAELESLRRWSRVDSDDAGFVLVPGLCDAATTAVGDDDVSPRYVCEHLDADRASSVGAVAWPSDPVDDVKRANRSCGFGDVVAEIQAYKLQLPRRMVLFEVGVPESPRAISAEIKAQAHRLCGQSMAIDLAQCVAQDMRAVLAAVLDGVLELWKPCPPTSPPAPVDSRTRRSWSSGRGGGAGGYAPNHSSSARSVQSAGSVGSTTSAGSPTRRPAEAFPATPVAGVGGLESHAPPPVTVFGGLPPPYKSPREKRLGRPHARLLRMTRAIEQVAAHIALRLSNCRSVNEWPKEFAALLTRFADQCVASEDSGGSGAPATAANDGIRCAGVGGDHPAGGVGAVSGGLGIVELRLGSNQLNSRSFAEVCPSLAGMPHLLVLDLSDNRLQSEDLHLLGPLLASAATAQGAGGMGGAGVGGVGVGGVGGGGVGGGGGGGIGAVGGGTAAARGGNGRRFQLQRLVLWGNDLGFDGAAVLAQYLQDNDTLFAVDVGSNNIGDQGFERLLGALQQSSRSRLRWLGCDHDGLTSASVVNLARALSTASPAAPLREVVVSMLGNQFHHVERLREVRLPLPGLGLVPGGADGTCATNSDGAQLVLGHGGSAFRRLSDNLVL